MRGRLEHDVHILRRSRFETTSVAIGTRRGPGRALSARHGECCKRQEDEEQIPRYPHHIDDSVGRLAVLSAALYGLPHSSQVSRQPPADFHTSATQRSLGGGQRTGGNAQATVVVICRDVASLCFVFSVCSACRKKVVGRKPRDKGFRSRLTSL